VGVTGKLCQIKTRISGPKSFLDFRNIIKGLLLFFAGTGTGTPVYFESFVLWKQGMGCEGK
jgi:hypothetical protein